MFQIVFGVAGGLALFLYGMNLCSDGLQRASGSALKKILSKLTSSPVMGVITGTIVTVLIQSSSATTVILVGLVGAKLMTLAQSIGVILGADIGTTLTVQLIAFNVTSYSLLFIAIGFLINFISKRDKVKQIGQVILGFGMIFFGMGIMSSTMQPLKDYPGVPELFASFGSNPLMGLLVSTVFTAIIQGSAATIGIVLSLSLQGIVPLEAAIPLVLGANIGTCATALLATIGAPTEAKRVGIAHVLFKILGVVIFMPFVAPFTNLVKMTAADVTRQIANAHTIFNVGITVFFLPFAHKFAQLIEWMIPEKAEAIPDFQKPQYLKRQSLDTPVIAIEQARAETGRVAQMVQEMAVGLTKILDNYDETVVDRINQIESGIDNLYREIIHFLSEIAQHNLTKEQSNENILWIQTINDLEHIGDALIRMLTAIKKKLENQVSFSDEGEQELRDFLADVVNLTESLVLAIDTPEKENIEQVARQAVNAIEKEQTMRISHIRRLHAQVAVSLDTSPLHLDITNSVRRIAEHALLIANNLSDGVQSTHREVDMQTFRETAGAH